MLRALLYIVLLMPFPIFAQEVIMENGKLMAGNTLYANYDELGEKKHTLSVSNSMVRDLSPEAGNNKFKDVIFSTPGGEQVIFATAKVLSSPYTGLLTYYYNIQFGTMDAQLNMRYHPLTMQTLAKDLVKYRILKEGKLDEDAAVQLIKYWNKKPNAIDDRLLQVSSRTNYNNSVYHTASELEKNPLNVHDHKIYSHDSLIGVYSISKKLGTGILPGTSKGDFYYFINYPDGKLMAEVQLQILQSALYVWPAPQKDPVKMYTSEREEENVIKAACIMLMDRKQQLAFSNNK